MQEMKWCMIYCELRFFWSLVMWFANDFSFVNLSENHWQITSRVTKRLLFTVTHASHEWKSLVNPITLDQKLVIHGNSCIIVYSSTLNSLMMGASHERGVRHDRMCQKQGKCMRSNICGENAVINTTDKYVNKNLLADWLLPCNM